MTIFDCKSQHSKCKACCCGPVPIDKQVYADNQHKMNREPIDILDLDDSIIPITDSGYCVFLSDSLECGIYDQRPEVCRKFGDESHPMLTCAYLKANGQERSRQNRRLIERKMGQQQQDILCRFL